MKLKTCLLQVMAAGTIALIVAACSPSAPADSALSLPEPRPTAAPTPVPAEAVTTAKQFAGAQAQIETDWDEYHRKFDQWRAGLTSCSRAAAETAFRRFASGASAISVQVRDLPRSSDVRDLADMLVEAAEAEETTLRRLSDRWQPGNTALFEAVAEQRSKSINAQISVADGLEDLKYLDPDIEEIIEDFAEEFESVSDDWRALQEDYAEISAGGDTLTDRQLAERLDDLIDEFGKLREAVEELSASPSVDDLIEDLLDALDDQVEALKELHSQFSGTGGATSAPPKLKVDAPPPDGKETEPDNDAKPGDDANTGDDADSGEPPEPEPEPDPPAESPSFEDADQGAADSDEVLAKVQDDIAALQEDPAAAVDIDLESVAEFEKEYLLLLDAWDNFHTGYSGWRATDGGCDRAAVSKALAGYSETLSGLAGQVRGLPRESYMRPMGAPLIEAVQREQEAMRVLSYNWRPFGTDAFRAFDLERNSSRELRRQADIGVQELLSRFGAG